MGTVACWWGTFVDGELSIRDGFGPERPAMTSFNHIREIREGGIFKNSEHIPGVHLRMGIQTSSRVLNSAQFQILKLNNSTLEDC